jgi:hypothetical protein
MGDAAESVAPSSRPADVAAATSAAQDDIVPQVPVSMSQDELVSQNQTDPAVEPVVNQPGDAESQPATHPDGVNPVALADPSWVPMPGKRSGPAFDRRYGWLRSVNPLMDRGGGFRTNCVLTAIATDMTLADRFDAATAGDNAHFQAPTSSTHKDEVVHGRATDLVNYSGNQFREVPDYRAVQEAMRNAPVGSRGIVVVTDVGGTVSHAFNAVRDDKGVAFLDGQAGEWATAPQRPARIRFMPVAGDIPEPRTRSPLRSPLPDGDPVGAIGIEIEVPVVLETSPGVQLGYNDVIAKGPGVEIKVDKNALGWIPEVVSKPGAAMPGEVREHGSARELTRRAREVARALQAATPGSPTALAELLKNLDGFEAVGKGKELKVHRPADVDIERLYTQYSVGVPYWGLKRFLKFAAARSESSPRTLLEAGLALGDSIARQLVESDPRIGPADADILAGTLALVYPHIAGQVAGWTAPKYLSKNFIGGASRMTFRSVRAGLPVSVQNFLDENADWIKSEINNEVRRSFSRIFDRSAVDEALRRDGLVDDEGYQQLFSSSARGRFLNDYLNNVLFDQHDDQGAAVPFVDQNQSVSIGTQFDELDNKGGLPYPLIVLELRYYDPRSTSEGVHENFEQILREVSGLTPPDITRTHAERMAAANESANARAALAIDDVTSGIADWERHGGRGSLDTARANLRLAKDLVDVARDNVRYAAEFRAAIDRTDQLSDLRQQARDIEATAAEHARRAESAHRVAVADLQAGEEGRSFVPVDEARRDALVQATATAVELNDATEHAVQQGRQQQASHQPERTDTEELLDAAASTVEQAHGQLDATNDNLRQAARYRADVSLAGVAPSQQEQAERIEEIATQQANQARINYIAAIDNLVAGARNHPGGAGLARLNEAAATVNNATDQANQQWRQSGRDPAQAHLHLVAAMFNLDLARHGVVTTRDNLRAIPDDGSAPAVKDTASALVRDARVGFHAAADNLVDGLLRITAAGHRPTDLDVPLDVRNRVNAVVAELNESIAHENSRWQQSATDPADPVRVPARLAEAAFNLDMARRHYDTAHTNLQAATKYRSRFLSVPATDSRRQWADYLRNIAADLEAAALAYEDEARRNLDAAHAAPAQVGGAA